MDVEIFKIRIHTCGCGYKTPESRLWSFYDE